MTEQILKKTTKNPKKIRIPVNSGLQVLKSIKQSIKQTNVKYTICSKQVYLFCTWITQDFWQTRLCLPFVLHLYFLAFYNVNVFL